MGCREDELVRLHTCDRVDDTLRIGGAHGQSKRKWGGWSSPLGVGVVSGGLSQWVGAQVSIEYLPALTYLHRIWIAAKRT